MVKITKLKRYKQEFEKAKEQLEKKKEDLAKAELEIFSKYGRLKFEELQLKNKSHDFDIDELILEQTAINKALKNKIKEEKISEPENQKADFLEQHNG